jgi:hypothetical protein
MTVMSSRNMESETEKCHQELDVSVESKIEIRTPTRSWRISKQSISSIVVYKDWMYCAGSQVDGSAMKVMVKFDL